MNVAKDIARDWLPPAVVRWIRQFRGRGIRFEGEFATWEEASLHCSGYNAKNILNKVLEATLKVKHGEATFERDSVLFDEIEYAWPVLAGLMWVAARNGGSLNVLDFGGALGSSYFQNLKFLQALPHVRWNVVEQEHFVNAGRKYIQDEGLRFYNTVEDCLAENKPSVILLSSVLQYLPRPYILLNEILALNSDMVILDRTCYLNQGEEELITVQRVPESIYEASYPCRYLGQKTICNFFAINGYKVVEIFESIDELNTLATWKGHIFQRNKNVS